MRSHRLDRLARLTQGMALVGLGLTEAACGEPRVNSPHPDNQPHVNAPPEKPEAGDAGATSAAPKPFDGPVNSVKPEEPTPPHTINAMPAPTTSGSAAPAKPTPPAKPQPPRTNSPGPMAPKG